MPNPPNLTIEPSKGLVLQRHELHGGRLRGDHHHDPQLPPPARRHARHARVGAEGIPAVDPVGAANEPPGREDNAEDHHDAGAKFN